MRAFEIQGNATGQFETLPNGGGFETYEEAETALHNLIDTTWWKFNDLRIIEVDK